MFGSFVVSRNGSVSLIFALVAIPLLGFAGGAIDFSLASNEKEKMQSALDSALLAAASKRGDFADAERVSDAREALNGNYKPPRGKTLDATILVEADRTLSGRADVAVPTSFLRLLGIDQLPITVQSQVTLRGNTKAEIALVLDYSGSMKTNDKYISMRDAAIDLVEDLLGGDAAAGGSNVKIGLVPFSEYVFTEMETEFIRDVHPDKYGVKVRGCLDSRRYPFATEDTTPAFSIQDSKWPAPGMPHEFRTPGRFVDPAVNGLIDPSTCKGNVKTVEICEQVKDEDDDEPKTKCRMEQVPTDECLRTYNSSEQSEQNSEAIVSDFSANNPQCLAYQDRQLLTQPLTNDRSALVMKLNAMTPVRLTNIALGLEYGWHMISPNAPFTSAGSYGSEDVRKAIVMLTDGRQTVGGFGSGGSFSVSQAETNTEELCSAIKARDVLMVTVAFDLRDAMTKNRLRKCATKPKYFYDAATKRELADAFQEITAELAGAIRLVR